MSSERTKKSISQGVQYYVWLIGQGYGCDYSIACNECLRALSADDLEQAKQEVAMIVDEYGEPEIEDAVIIHTDRLHIFDIDEHRNKAKEELRRQEESQRESIERKQFEQLKKKFEPDV